MNRDPQAWARLGQALANARNAQGLRQDQLAEAAGVSTGAVQNAEAGRVPRGRMPYTLAAIAKALGWPASAVDDVLAGGDPPDGWRDVSVEPEVKEARVEQIVSNAMLRVADGATGAEIKKATREALDALRREGLI